MFIMLMMFVFLDRMESAEVLLSEKAGHGIIDLDSYISNWRTAGAWEAVDPVTV